MNPIAEQALAKAMVKGATPVPVAGHFDRLGYLEGRRHATDIVLAAGMNLTTPGWEVRLLESLRRNAEGKPPSFARGVFEVIELLERGVAHD